MTKVMFKKPFKTTNCNMKRNPKYYLTSSEKKIVDALLKFKRNNGQLWCYLLVGIFELTEMFILSEK